jgi:hypothetical protein
MFKKAIKYAAKGRVALVGPSGSGKSYSMVTLAKALAKGGKIAAIDTEHGSLSKYADVFDFDVLELDSYSPQNLLEALGSAAHKGYAVFCCDSLSHFWTGKGGALEFVDQANARNNDKMSGWKDFRPHEREMVDAILGSPCHIVCTMRTKTEYRDIVENGKMKRVKIGLAPVQREGLEYEFDLVGYMDEDNTLIVDKTRCPLYQGKAIRKPDLEAFTPFVQWLEGSVRPPSLSQNGKQLITAEQWARIKDACFRSGCSTIKLLAYYRVEKPSALPAIHFDDAMKKATNPANEMRTNPRKPDEVPA